jgi:hypothetical protein
MNRRGQQHFNRMVVPNTGMQALAANNGQAYSMQPGQAYAFQYGQALTVDPSACVRAPYDQWYMSAGDCQAGLPADQECNARYINGVWTYYKPYARDSKTCAGILPPDILPQILDGNSMVQGDLGADVLDVTLSLFVNGNIGELRVVKLDQNGAPRTYTATFKQSDQIMDELYSPLLYRYSVMAPGFNGEKVLLEINTGNGYAKVLFGAGDAPGVASFIMTNIPPVMPQAVAAMRAR